MQRRSGREVLPLPGLLAAHHRRNTARRRLARAAVTAFDQRGRGTAALALRLLATPPVTSIPSAASPPEIFTTEVGERGPARGLAARPVRAGQELGGRGQGAEWRLPGHPGRPAQPRPLGLDGAVLLRADGRRPGRGVDWRRQPSRCTWSGTRWAARWRWSSLFATRSLVRRLVVVDVAPVRYDRARQLRPLRRRDAGAGPGRDPGPGRRRRRAGLCGVRPRRPRVPAAEPAAATRGARLAVAAESRPARRPPGRDRRTGRISTRSPTPDRCSGSPVPTPTTSRPRTLPLCGASSRACNSVTVKNSGHWVHSEQPETFVATIRAFLRRA